MTLDQAIQLAKQQAAQHRQTLFIVLDPQECDDSAAAYHFGSAAAIRSVFAGARCVAAVHPDSRVIDYGERVAA